MCGLMSTIQQSEKRQMGFTADPLGEQFIAKLMIFMCSASKFEGSNMVDV
jgi:hypothetical protein